MTKSIFAAFSLCTLFGSTGAFAFPAVLNVSWNASQAQVELINNQNRPMDCSGKLQGVHVNGASQIQPFYFTSIEPGGVRYSYLFAAAAPGFVNAGAIGDCQYVSNPGGFPEEPDPAEKEPEGTVIGSGTFNAMNGVAMAGTAKLYETGVNQYALRVENLAGLPREAGLEVRLFVDNYSLGMTYLKAAGGSQNFPFSAQIPSGIHRWYVEIYSTYRGLDYAESVF